MSSRALKTDRFVKQYREGPGQFFRDRIAFFRNKLNLPTRRWDDIWREAHNSAFVVAGAYKADLLNDLREAVDKGITRGESIGKFRQRFDSIVKRHGWQHRGSRNWRTRVIYETNLRNSYAAGRYRQLKSPAMVKARPFWQYNHNDRVAHPRPHHVAWDGTVLRNDDPWWDTHYPPAGWGCRCFIRALGVRDMASLGKLGPDQSPRDGVRTVNRQGRQIQVPVGVDPGFDYIPGVFRGRQDGAILARTVEALSPKLSRLPRPLARGLARVMVAGAKGQRLRQRFRLLRQWLPRSLWSLIVSTSALRLTPYDEVDEQ